VEKAGGDLTLEAIENGVVASCGGDGELTLRKQPQSDCSVHAGGDLNCTFEKGINCTVHAMSGGDLCVSTHHGSQEISSSHYSFQIGEKGCTVNLMAGGDIDIQLADEMQRITPDIGDVKTGEPFDPAAFKDWESRYCADRVIHVTIPNVEPDITKAQEKIEKAGNRIQAAVRKIFTEEKNPTATVIEIPPASPAYQPEASQPAVDIDAAEPVTDDERLMILQMVQDKKITVEEATKLLETLDQFVG
jgi:hypothetical protein